MNTFMKEVEKINISEFDKFGEVMADGMLTEVSDDNVYRLREAISLSENLGRPLTEDELRAFEVCQVVAEETNYKTGTKK